MTDNAAAETGKGAVKWYLRPVWIVIAILAAGPFAIPLVWMSPFFKRWLKIAITIALLALTVWMAQELAVACRSIVSDMQRLGEALKF